ncbi:type III secretion periplasmic lipoprotein [Simkania negevensis]|uniref:Type III secretion periplasmic lipoprotein n=1 Tax=Simkania negevensis (strain ATCC VR-1471 / DSM 27360 / Z) TaxID=331113 RepID=F8L4M9_SIMNZ|nr:type III secretion periplasmic lipoprotein [Simkania negevensis]CCB88170.1 type III secretion periplasmic lipoprotein [Simkania negevensis Z]
MMRNKIKSWLRSLIVLGSLSSTLLIFTGCDSNQAIVSNIDEKEANVILVLLESKGIPAQKAKSETTQIGGGGAPKYSIMVPEKNTIDAIAYLNQNGFPRQQGTNLLDLFAKQGLMTSDKEETIRYQAGLAQQLTNTILMIDGVIDASVQLSFPPEESVLGTPGQTQQKRITAAVYVKHQGVIDDPNIHLENKIKRLISGSVTGLDINDVTVVSDRSRFTDITLGATPESLSGKPGEYVSIWNIVMSKESAARFRFLFFFITALAVILAVAFGWLVWKFYPTLKKKGAFKTLLSPIPWIGGKKGSEETSSSRETPPEG